MSFESGKKLGLTASLIAVAIPVVGVITVVVFILSLFANALSGTSGSSTLLGFIIFIIVLGIISFAGTILFILAMHHLAEYYGEPGIFRNVLYGFLINVVGTIAAVAIYAAAVIASLRNISNSSSYQATAFITPSQTLQTSLSGGLTQILTGYIVLLIVSFVLAIVSAVFYMRAFNKLGEKSGVYNFKTAGLLYLLGGALAVVGIGVLLSWIAWIFALMGFRSLKPQTSEVSSLSTTPQFTPSSVQKRYCTHCGAENNLDSFYCKSCGKRMQ